MSESPKQGHFGPFECIQEVKGDGRAFLSLPYNSVAGARLTLAVRDNFAKLATFTFSRQYWATLELTIWGKTGGFEDCLKRQQVRMESGPMILTLPMEESFEEIAFRGVNVSGGRLGPPGVSGAADPSQANGFSIQVSLYRSYPGGIV